MSWSTVRTRAGGGNDGALAVKHDVLHPKLDHPGVPSQTWHGALAKLKQCKTKHRHCLEPPIVFEPPRDFAELKSVINCKSVELSSVGTIDLISQNFFEVNVWFTVDTIKKLISQSRRDLLFLVRRMSAKTTNLFHLCLKKSTNLQSQGSRSSTWCDLMARENQVLPFLLKLV